MSEHRTMQIKPSRWQWNRFKDMLHFYTFLGVIPSTLIILYTNIFIGPAKLAEIPENYVPEAHEYYSVSVKVITLSATHLQYLSIFSIQSHVGWPNMSTRATSKSMNPCVNIFMRKSIE